MGKCGGVKDLGAENVQTKGLAVLFDIASASPNAKSLIMHGLVRVRMPSQ
jgi:hypothetical protein